MNKLKFDILSKVMMLFVVMFLLLCWQLGTSYYLLNIQQNKIVKEYELANHKQQVVYRIKHHADMVIKASNSYIIFGNVTLRALSMQKIVNGRNLLTQDLEELKSLLTTNQELKLFETIVKQRMTAKGELDVVLKHVDKGDMQEASIAYVRIQSYIDNFYNSIDELIALQEKNNMVSKAEVKHYIEDINEVFYGLIIIIVILSVVLIFYVNKIITKSIGRVTNSINKTINIAKRLSIDNLDTPIEEYNGEGLEEVINALRKMQQSLKTSLSELSKAANSKGLNEITAAIALELENPIGTTLLSASTVDAKMEEIYKLYQSNTLKRSDIITFFDLALPTIKLIIKSCERMSVLIVSFKHIFTDQSSETITNFNLYSLVEDTITSLAPSFTDKKYDIFIELSQEINCTTYAGALNKILIALIQNAYSHSFCEEGHGVIIISAVTEGNLIKLSVQDNGCGIDNEYIPHIFDPYYTTKTNTAGTGLGLYTAKSQAVSMLKGDITVISNIGTGSTFTVSFPRNNLTA